MATVNNGLMGIAKNCQDLDKSCVIMRADAKRLAAAIRKIGEATDGLAGKLHDRVEALRKSSTAALLY